MIIMITMMVSTHWRTRMERARLGLAAEDRDKLKFVGHGFIPPSAGPALAPNYQEATSLACFPQNNSSWIGNDALEYGSVCSIGSPTGYHMVNDLNELEQTKLHQ